MRSLILGIFMICNALTFTADAEQEKYTRDGKPFVHPGILHSQAQINFVREKIQAGEQPWIRGWEAMKRHKFARLSWKPDAHAHIVRGPYNNPQRGANEFIADSDAAYTHALIWCLTEEKAHAQKAVEILNAYARTVKSIGEHDAKLLVGMAGIKLVNAAELMKHIYDGWEKKDQQQFAQMLRQVLYPVIEDFYPTANGNWDASMIQTMMAMGVFLDDHAMFERAVNYYLNGEGNGAITKYFNEFGQCQETGRDQAHTQMGIGFLSNAAEIGWRQGVDLYSAADHRLLKGYEYTAKYNLGHDVPYEPYVSHKKRYHYKKISDKARGRFSDIYDRVYYHYHYRKGMKMPYVKRVLEKISVRRHGGAHVPWGKLMQGD